VYGSNSNFSFRSSSTFFGTLKPEDHVKRLNIFSKVCLSLSIIFWFRALYNTRIMSGGFDLGVISYAGSIFSSCYLYLKSKRGVDKFTGTPTLARTIVLATHLIVASNHTLGIYVAYNIYEVVYVKFAYYSLACTIFWLFAAICGWRFITNTMDIGVVQNDDTEMEGLYRFKDTTNTVNEELLMYGDQRGLSYPMR